MKAAVVILTLGWAFLAGCATRHHATTVPNLSNQNIASNTSATPSSTTVQCVSHSEAVGQMSTESVRAPSHEAVEATPPLVPAPIARDAYATFSGFDVETLVAMALDANPAVLQAEAEAAEASGVRCQVGLPPNPSIGYFGQELGNDGAGGQHGVFASQTIVRGDKLRWNRCVVSHDVDRLRWLAEAQRQRLATDVRIHFFDALAAQRKLQQALAFREAAERAVTIVQQRLEAQEGTKSDLLQSELMVDQIDLSIRQAELDWEAAWAALTATIGQPSLVAAELFGDFVSAETVDNIGMYERIASASPTLRAAQARIDRARTNLQRQRLQVIPI